MQEGLKKVMWEQRKIFTEAGLLVQTMEGEWQFLEAAKGKGMNSPGT